MKCAGGAVAKEAPVVRAAVNPRFETWGYGLVGRRWPSRAWVHAVKKWHHGIQVGGELFSSNIVAGAGDTP
jgi:hypothetical protein